MYILPVIVCVFLFLQRRPQQHLGPVTTLQRRLPGPICMFGLKCGRPVYLFLMLAVAAAVLGGCAREGLLLAVDVVVVFGLVLVSGLTVAKIVLSKGPVLATQIVLVDPDDGVSVEVRNCVKESTSAIFLIFPFPCINSTVAIMAVAFSFHKIISISVTSSGTVK